MEDFSGISKPAFEAIDRGNTGKYIGDLMDDVVDEGITNVPNLRDDFAFRKW